MLSFEQNKMGFSLRCFIPNLVDINPLVPGSVFTIYVHGSHLGYVTSMMLLNFISLYLKAYIQNLVENAPVVPEKSKFYFLYGTDLGPRSRLTLGQGQDH